MRILVLGGHGFIGRHAVAALQRSRHKVVIGTRTPGRRATVCRERAVDFGKMTDPGSWMSVLTEIDVVINCVGILRPRWGESYEDVHQRAPQALARACAASGVAHLVHVSALGLNEQSVNGFLTSKRSGEKALRQFSMGAPATRVTVVRPSLLDGDDGFGSVWLRRVAQLPLLAVPSDAQGLIAALDVDDLGEILVNVATDAAPLAWREVEVGGTPRTLADHLLSLRAPWRARPAIVRVPALLAKAAAVLLDALHLTPMSVGHLELMRAANVPVPNVTAHWLRRVPRMVGRMSWVTAQHPRPVAGATARDQGVRLAKR
jgi:NADH dehydrogenase